MSVLIFIASAWLAINLFHSLWIGYRHWRWESAITRDKNGLLPQAEAYTRGNGPVALLFVHGFADTPMLWSPMVDHINKQSDSFTCRAMRLPGSGEPLSVAHQQTLVTWRHAIDDEIVTLRKTHTHIWLISHSTGGALSIDSVLRNPGAVQGLILLAPLIKVSRYKIPLIPPEAGFTCAQVIFVLSPIFESIFFRKTTVADDPAYTYIRDRFISFQVYRNLFSLIHANQHHASKLTIPVFAALSKFDRVVDSKAACQWLENVQGKKEVRWTETGHVIHLAPGWQALTDDILTFIKTTSKAE
jgi:alpha-beta hydrolase superfamily lysophospholipase